MKRAQAGNHRDRKLNVHDREPPESISELIRSARHKHKLSQRELADALIEASGRDTVTRSDVSRWERGKRIPTGHWLYWLSHVLQVPLAGLRHAATVARKYRLMAAVLQRPPWHTDPPDKPERNQHDAENQRDNRPMKPGPRQWPLS
ncbi:transcriptional regulator with XRE-family HTH domain [Kibdelosporangium banguiense]|uniref:Transcriptional regulator with XRE-family HTH domain n=1 Tax=Kibdelosporangium banguiense TaxID=1365924 RepID=A0ABS4TGA5_9PSEU|nr:helix-turn-helix transcriptional regulator [Kibdelosporangium banguiense]MBP2323448.1 transcriptional regulator with XRE-family HTH domain [Kibdelosporangium banguiense]